MTRTPVAHPAGGVARGTGWTPGFRLAIGRGAGANPRTAGGHTLRAGTSHAARAGCSGPPPARGRSPTETRTPAARNQAGARTAEPHASPPPERRKRLTPV